MVIKEKHFPTPAAPFNVLPRRPLLSVTLSVAQICFVFAAILWLAHAIAINVINLFL